MSSIPAIKKEIKKDAIEARYVPYLPYFSASALEENWPPDWFPDEWCTRTRKDLIRSGSKTSMELLKGGN